MEKKHAWTIGTILTWTRQYFQDKGVDNPRLDAEVLLSHILGKDRLYLYVHFDQPLEQRELEAFRAVVKRRVLREPVAYITGCREFMGLAFQVSPAVLIPRPDTEILVETVLAKLAGQNTAAPALLDIGTGSGAIIISMLHTLTAATGVAVDISPEALLVARENAYRLGVDDRLTLCKGDVFSAVAGRQFDVIVSNPPYIPQKDITGLTSEVRKEPHLALDGGVDGLDFYRRISQAAPAYLVAGGLLAFEVGQGQADAVAELGRKQQFLVEAIVKDYGGIDRVVLLRDPRQPVPQ
ncbi:peptide chain release factor N(5)-glutamine methyltransferase [Propionispora hippei]|uniref:Release factor glutamine methyltransferase n=1 Tax=Propionispora hippei DSM 15287 TaxID=1123003 RepID=A0A1M6BPT3_9FIRM|nr:peptide chain release factor N(5)-glutamine methyltransferase [Propionispora hippei]SHI50711.1 release factor glutamine methyltransferase [Propionispora hippei DSM 15287]